MELTGKAKKDFEKWLNITPLQGESTRYNLPFFYNLSLSLQYGVYVDWFDSVGIEITTKKNYKNGHWVMRIQGLRYMKHTKTRYEARTEAIKKANEIYNTKTL